jgi:hypothetical protein
MSACAVTPETYDAWRYLETDDEELHEREDAEMARGEEELALLLAGTNVFVSHPHEVDGSCFLTLSFPTNCRPRSVTDSLKTRTIPQAIIRAPVLHTTLPSA